MIIVELHLYSLALAFAVCRIGQNFGSAKVGDHNVPIGTDQNILRLQVPVNDFAPMQELQGAQDF
jgi:hypothetical protein